MIIMFPFVSYRGLLFRSFVRTCLDSLEIGVSIGD